MHFSTTPLKWWVDPRHHLNFALWKKVIEFCLKNKLLCKYLKSLDFWYSYRVISFCNSERDDLLKSKQTPSCKPVFLYIIQVADLGVIVFSLACKKMRRWSKREIPRSANMYNLLFQVQNVAYVWNCVIWWWNLRSYFSVRYCEFFPKLQDWPTSDIDCHMSVLLPIMHIVITFNISILYCNF